MISKFSLTAAVVAAGLMTAMTPASAATLSVGALKDTAAASSQVEKAHFWHRTCRKGLNGWHKHVRGIGRVQCTNHKCYRDGHCVWF